MQRCSSLAANGTAPFPANLNLNYDSTTLYQIPKFVTTNGQCRANENTPQCANQRTPPGVAPGPLNSYTTGLDPSGSSGGKPNLPTPNENRHLSVDAEGLVNLPFGFKAVSDEYGPYVHIVAPSFGPFGGEIVYSLRPVDAVVPKNANGTDDFYTVDPIVSGRVPNQGFEGMTFDPSTNTLWLLLQSATYQDSKAGDKSTNRYTRLFGYRFNGDWTKPAPELVAEYVVALPQSAKGKTYAQSEVHLVDSTTFIVLARDGNGFGDSDSKSTYKNAALFSTKGAQDIKGQYDGFTQAVAPGGKLLPNVTAIGVTNFVDLVDADQLAKFGIHNGGAIDRNLVPSKLESLAVTPAGNAQNKDEYLLWVASDNDFITLDGNQRLATPGTSGSANVYVNTPFSDPYAQSHGLGGDSMVFVYKVTLPGFTGTA